MAYSRKYWDKVLSDEFKTHRDALLQLSREELIALAQEYEVPLRGDENLIELRIHVGHALREDQGIEQYKLEYRSEGARVALMQRLGRDTW